MFGIASSVRDESLLRGLAGKGSWSCPSSTSEMLRPEAVGFGKRGRRPRRFSEDETLISNHYPDRLARKVRISWSSRRAGVRSLLVFGTAVLIWLVCSVESRAQEPEGTNSARVLVGNDKTGPGGDAFVPIVFAPAASESVGTVIVEIRYPEKDLVFQEIKGADSDRMTVSAVTEKDPKEPGRTLLRVTVESKTGALESGILGNLIFKVSNSVAFGEKIALPQVARALSPGPSPQPVELAAIDGLIDVSAAPGVFSCFFYMH